MLLVIDVGNTNSVLGLYDGDRLVEHWRVATKPHMTIECARFAPLVQQTPHPS